MAETIDGTNWLTLTEISTQTKFSISRVRNVVQVLESIEAIKTRIDPQDGKSKLVREGDLGVVIKALNRGN
jgi:DNA-binding transcriptional regulator GbsR (MarR family)